MAGWIRSPPHAMAILGCVISSNRGMQAGLGVGVTSSLFIDADGSGGYSKHVSSLYSMLVSIAVCASKVCASKIVYTPVSDIPLTTHRYIWSDKAT